MACVCGRYMVCRWVGRCVGMGPPGKWGKIKKNFRLAIARGNVKRFPPPPGDIMPEIWKFLIFNYPRLNTPWKPLNWEAKNAKSSNLLKIRHPKMVIFQHRLSKIKAFWLKNHVVNFFPIFGSFNLDREVFLNLANFDNKGLLSNNLSVLTSTYCFNVYQTTFCVFIKIAC